jgi:lysyl-tRNA synthetase class 2
MGRSTFLHLQDSTGRIQAYFKQDVLGPEQYALLDLIEAGDFLGVVGETIRTRSGEVRVQAAEMHVLSKALRPLPEKWHGLQDVETRYRKRYLT